MTDVAEELHRLVRSGQLAVPFPGSGQTWARWQALATVSRRNTVLGRLAEAHCDAVATMHELDGPAVDDAQVWGLWAAEPPNPVVEATHSAAGWRLNGRKLWCSGASICTHALITARLDEKARGLFAVDLGQPGVKPIPGTWAAVGMSESDSGAVELTDAAAVMIGNSGDYLARPGFWHGAIGVAACWYGSACAVADPLHRRLQAGHGDAHAAAHLGAVGAALLAARTSLHTAAEQIDTDPLDKCGVARVRARAVRAIVETAATDVLNRVGRALGAAPLCADAEHAHRVADLTVYLRQSHAERDLADLGYDLAATEQPW